MTRRTAISLANLFIIPLFSLQAQVLEPVTWSFGSEKTADNKFDIVMTADIDDSWHLYAMDIAEGGPIATSFTFEEPSGYTLEGKPVAVDKPEVKFDNSFGMDIGMHSVKAGFRQKITVNQYPATVKGFVTFMSCDDKQCLPPRDVEFSIVIGGDVAAAASTDKTGPVESVSDNSLQTPGGAPAKEPGKGLLKFFLLSMLAGFAGILTPCVFPMIPMTVAFFSQGAEKKGSAIGKALVFGLTIILLYSSLGIIVSLTSAGAGFANTLSTHWIPNLLFFALFLVFAASFFGAFEIVLPSKWVSSSDSKG